MLVKKSLKIFRKNKWKNYRLEIFFQGFICDHKKNLSRYKISSVRTFSLGHFWTFIFVHFSKFKKLSQDIFVIFVIMQISRS